MTSGPTLNATHDPALRSWLASANRPDSDFPIQNLPFGVFRRAATTESFRGGVAIGDQIVDLAALHQHRIVSGSAADALETCTGPALNSFMALGPDAWSALRRALSTILREGSAVLEPGVLVPQSQAQFALPAKIGGYTDFYASIHHATAVGTLLRPDNPLLPNYKWVPIAYHGRTSSIRVSGQQFPRPYGQVKVRGADPPEWMPSRRIDYELEVGICIGPGNRLGTPITIDQAESHVFGLCLLNDWSARDIQAWEAQPLGPFLAKNFATTLSPWMVTLEALAPYRSPWTRVETDPQPLAYLDSPTIRQSGSFDMELAAYIETPQMRAANSLPHRLARSNFKYTYWTVAQMIAQHTVNGCNLEPGDLLGSGTQSGPSPEEAGSLLELTVGGKNPITLSSGETRAFLADGDRVLLRGGCERAGYARIGFGEAAGTLMPAADLQNAK
jgi:fumarylacetoacetase